MDREREFDVRAAVVATIEDVDALGLNGADRAVTLGVVLARRLGLVAPDVSGGVSKQPDSLSDATGHDGTKREGLLAKIAKVTKLPSETLEMVYDEKDGELGYVISPKKLADNKAEATRQLARIVALGRQSAGLEEWTPSSAIREVVNDYGKFDSANFASHINGLDKDNVALIRGKGASREVKVTRTGIELTSAMIQALSAA